MLFRQLATLFCLSLLCLGCQNITSSVSSVAHKPFSTIAKETQIQPVSEMICLWEEAEGLGLDEKPTRGFAGQLMFFSANASEPVPIHGDIEIFLFDDLGTEDEQSKPLHTFKFEQAAFEAFKTETNLGIAYQLFLPYVRKSSYNANCSLRVRISPKEGRQLYSKMASVNLNGPESPQSIARAKREQTEIQLVNAQLQEKQKPLSPTSPEQTAAYFGAASLPLPQQNVDAGIDKQRLKSALSSVVQQDPKAPRTLSTHVQRNSAQIVPKQPTRQKHPLLDD